MLFPLVGIDPGKQGAMALATSPYRVIVADFPLLQGNPDRQKLYSLSALARGGIAWIETPQFRPHDGKDRVFKSGGLYECWKFPLLIHGVEIKEVTAAAWKKEFNLWKKGKEGSVSLAKKLFPNAEPLLKRKKDHDRAEALLILAYAVVTQEGEHFNADTRVIMFKSSVELELKRGVS